MIIGNSNGYRFLCRKIPKTLSGIETPVMYEVPPGRCLVSAGKYLKPYQGLKLVITGSSFNFDQTLSRKIPKTLSGIETWFLPRNCPANYQCRKIPKTLSGIETYGCALTPGLFLAGKYLKPYQGLKRHRRQDCPWPHTYAGKYLKPYQGLKRVVIFRDWSSCRAGKYLKPYQGLKQATSGPINI